MLLLAHLSRDEIPAILEADSHYVLRKSPQLLEEIVKIAAMPRPPHGSGWLAPTMGAIEFLQHLTQVKCDAVTIIWRDRWGRAAGSVPHTPLGLPHLCFGGRQRC